MYRTRRKIADSHYLPFVVLFIAYCWLVCLLLTVRPDVFFSGDAGIKFLIVGQINNGVGFKNLRLDHPGWVLDIWSQGFYPFKQPFIYDAPSGKTVAFPPAFQWLTAPFYRWFGYKGLYIIPSISLALLWAWFIVVIRQLTARPVIVACGLIIMAFCSPLTIYAAIYWEHTLAVLLVFSGLVFLLEPVAAVKTAMLGLLTGLAAWFRPESMIMSGLICGIACYNYFVYRKFVNVIFILSVLLVVTSFFVFNKIFYGSLLGAHAHQLMDESGSTVSFSKSLNILFHINVKFLVFFPAAILFYALTLRLLIKKPVVPSVIYQLLVVILLYSVITPFILPNAGGKQWGPRYFLPLIPFILAAIFLQVKILPLNKVWLVAGALLVAYSAYLNVYLAATTLSRDYAQRVSPGMAFLTTQDCKVVVVQNQFIAQEFAAASGNRIFFLAEDNKHFQSLLDKLRLAGVACVIYMTSSRQESRLPNGFNNQRRELLKRGDYFFEQYSLQ
ncbi:MAG: hypothetical protein WKF89_01055 [Chitinophagaceae bacterium]